MRVSVPRLVLNPTYLARQTRSCTRPHGTPGLARPDRVHITETDDDRRQHAIGTMRTQECFTCIGNGFAPYVALVDAPPGRIPHRSNNSHALKQSGAELTRDDEQAPNIQRTYSLNMPVSAIRTKLRQEFERHRFVNNLKTVDVLIFQGHAEFQETMNYWKQLNHVMKWFRVEEDPKAKLPQNFISGFLEVRSATVAAARRGHTLTKTMRKGTELIWLEAAGMDGLCTPTLCISHKYRKRLHP